MTENSDQPSPNFHRTSFVMPTLTSQKTKTINLILWTLFTVSHWSPVHRRSLRGKRLREHSDQLSTRSYCVGFWRGEIGHDKRCPSELRRRLIAVFGTLSYVSRFRIGDILKRTNSAQIRPDSFSSGSRSEKPPRASILVTRTSKLAALLSTQRHTEVCCIRGD